MYFVRIATMPLSLTELFERAKELRQKRSLEAVTQRNYLTNPLLRRSRIRAKSQQQMVLVLHKHDAKGDCSIKPVPEAQTDEAFCRLYYKLKHQSIPILEQMLTNLQMIRNRRCSGVLTSLP